MSHDKKHYFSSRLLNWYDKHRRDLPWRKNKNPYYIWISEVMLQQTRVDTVIPYFYRFVEKFPTVEALAEAPEEEVLKAWEGLGYYSRARNLQSAVREVHERYGGRVPSEKMEISSLKGVGPYTSGAILSIAYNKPEPAVDGNVMRVLSRYFLIQEDIMKGSTRVLMEKLAQELIPEGSAGDFNQALMELGAMVCTPKSPHCLTCPVMECCRARMEGMETSLPVKKKAKPPRPEQRLTALIEGVGENEGRFLIRQRPQEGLLARMWELPHIEWKPADRSVQIASSGLEERVDGPSGKPLRARTSELQPAEWGNAEEQMSFLRETLASEDSIDIEPLEWFLDTEHTFSHIHWDMKVYRCRLGSGGIGPKLSGFTPFHYRWVGLDELEQYAFPNVFLRVIKAYTKK